jgi:hypothetical protein
MAPPAPGRFTTTIGCPSFLLAASATSLIATSLPPPAGHGMTNVIGLSGNPAAAADSDSSALHHAAANTRQKNLSDM